jgi:hypothetical protein
LLVKEMERLGMARRMATSDWMVLEYTTGLKNEQYNVNPNRHGPEYGHQRLDGVGVHHWPKKNPLIMLTLKWAWPGIWPSATGWCWSRFSYVVFNSHMFNATEVQL